MSDYVVKIQEDAFRRAEELASVLKIEAPLALGMLVYLWRWVLTLKPDAAPDGIVLGRATCLRLEGAARWNGRRGALVEALLELGLITRQHKKLRVKGTETYAREWKKRAKKKERERLRRIAKKAGQQKQQSKTMPRLVSVASNPGTDEAGNPLAENALGFWTWLMRDRSAFTKGRVSADAAPSELFLSWHARMMADGVADRSLACAWSRYLLDPHFSARHWPVDLFIQEGVFRSRLTQHSA